MNPVIACRRIFGIAVDERFLDHRRRSSTFALMAGAIVAGGLFEYQLIRYHRYDWEVLSILLAMLVAKFTALAWFRLNR